FWRVGPRSGGIPAARMSLGYPSVIRFSTILFFTCFCALCVPISVTSVLPSLFHSFTASPSLTCLRLTDPGNHQPKHHGENALVNDPLHRQHVGDWQN